MHVSAGPRQCFSKRSPSPLHQCYLGCLSKVPISRPHCKVPDLAFWAGAPQVVPMYNQPENLSHRGRRADNPFPLILNSKDDWKPEVFLTHFRGTVWPMRCHEAMYDPDLLLHIIVNIHMLHCRNINVFDKKVLPQPYWGCYGVYGMCTKLPFWNPRTFWIQKHIWPCGFQIRGTCPVFSWFLHRWCLRQWYLGLTKIRKRSRKMTGLGAGRFHLSWPQFSLLENWGQERWKRWHLRPSDSTILIIALSCSLKKCWGITVTRLDCGVLLFSLGHV